MFSRYVCLTQSVVFDYISSAYSIFIIVQAMLSIAMYLCHISLFCYFYTKNEIYRRGYTPYLDSFIHLLCINHSEPNTLLYVIGKDLDCNFRKEKKYIVCSMFSSQWLYTQYQQLTWMIILFVLGFLITTYDLFLFGG